MLSWKVSSLAVAVACLGCVNMVERNSRQQASDSRPQPDPHDPTSGLYASIRDGNAERVRFVLSARPDLLDVCESSSKRPMTPLQIAAERNQVAVMKVLIELGADLEKGDELRGTPLQIAVRNNQREAAQLLLANGACLDMYSAVALDKRDHVAQYLAFASKSGLASSHAKRRYKFDWESTPLLHVATSRGHKEMAKLLIEHGADPAEVVFPIPCYISDINHKGVTVGLTPAGTFTGDLDVPVRKP